DRGGRGHPRRAGPPPGEAPPGPGAGRRDARRDPGRPPDGRRERGDRPGQRPGRHPAERALPGLRRGGEGVRQAGPDHRAQPGRRLRHQPGHGGLLDHGLPGRAGPPRAVGRPGEHPGPALGRLAARMGAEQSGRTKEERGEMDAFTAGQAAAWIGAAADAVAEGKERLTELDAAIGDGDHGANMDRGLGAAREAVAALDAAGPGEVLVKTGMTLISKVGGASGPLYGSFFRTAGKNLEGAGPDLAELAAALRAGLEAVQRMGAAQPGDKTMVDALSPAVTVLEQAAEKGTP